MSGSENYESPPIVADGPTLRRIAIWRAQLTEARAVLKLVEWVEIRDDGATYSICPGCFDHAASGQDGTKEYGHAPDCRLDKALNSHP